VRGDSSDATVLTAQRPDFTLSDVIHDIRLRLVGNVWSQRLPHIDDIDAIDSNMNPSIHAFFYVKSNWAGGYWSLTLSMIHLILNFVDKIIILGGNTTLTMTIAESKYGIVRTPCTDRRSIQLTGWSSSEACCRCYQSSILFWSFGWADPETWNFSGNSIVRSEHGNAVSRSAAISFFFLVHYCRKAPVGGSNSWQRRHTAIVIDILSVLVLVRMFCKGL
jgi:hypothetical protein